MKKSMLYFAIAGSILTSCGNSGQDKEKETQDSSAVAVNMETQKLMSLFKNPIALPFTVDSAFLAKEKFGDSLGTSELKLLAGNRFKHELMDPLEYELNDFYKIDSIKATGTYPQWCDKLDIGMTKYANAYAAGKIELDPNTTLLVWILKTESYEACPWSNSVAVYLTSVKNGVPVESCIAGESYGAGDAPVWMIRDIYSKLNTDGTMMMSWREENDDADGTESEVEERKYIFSIKDGKWQTVKEEKEKPYKVPHPKDTVQ